MWNKKMDLQVRQGCKNGGCENLRERFTSFAEIPIILFSAWTTLNRRQSFESDVVHRG